MKKVKVFLPIISSIILVFLISIWIRANYFIKIDNTSYSLVSSREINIEDIDAGNKYLLQKFESKNKEKRYFLRQKSFLPNSNRLELIGFEDNVAKCTGAELNSLLCFTGEVGVHSQNIQFIKLENRTLKYVYFIDKESVNSNATSDWPSIRAKDYNGDGTADIIIDNRNYSLDPLQDGIRDYYMRIGDSLVFDRSENFKYD